MSEWMAWAIMGGVILVGLLCFWFSHGDHSTGNGLFRGGSKASDSDHNIEAARAQSHAHGQGFGDGGGLGG